MVFNSGSRENVDAGDVARQVDGKRPGIGPFSVMLVYVVSISTAERRGRCQLTPGKCRRESRMAGERHRKIRSQATRRDHNTADSTP